MKNKKQAVGGKRRETSRKVRTSARLKLKQILVPVDFSDPSAKALRYAVPLARQLGATITLIYVNEPVPYPNDFVASFPLLVDDAKIARAAKSRLELFCKDEGLAAPLLQAALVRTGKPFQEICKAAQARSIDLIVLATHGYTGLKHALMGSTAEHVVRHAPCPVLTIR